jgi:hypothetical protein
MTLKKLGTWNCDWVYKKKLGDSLDKVFIRCL